jgi:16S rRNA (uracil1498-N3)-methyltransferase
MSRARFFLDGELSDERPVLLPLSPDDDHHARRVLRVRAGEELDVVPPSGSVVRVRVEAVSDDGIAVKVLGESAPAPELQVTLFQGVAKGDKMDAIVRQAVEVGAAGVVPVVTAFSVVKMDAVKRGRRGERWRRIAHSAAEQSRRSRVPSVIDPVDLGEALELLRGYDAVVVLWEEQQGRLLSSMSRELAGTTAERVALVVGPEGGLSAEEVATLREAGAVTASLGPSIMRTETAAVVALSLVVAAMQEAGSRGD